MACTNTGYNGYLLAASYMLPYLTADLTKVVEILPSMSVHGLGAGTVNPVARDIHNYSIGQQIIEGSVNVEVFQGTGNYATAFTQMLDRTIGASSTDMSDVCDGFNTTNKLIFAPAGGHEIVLPSSAASQGKAIVSNMDLRGNPGGNVQASFRIISAGADWNTPSSGSPGPNAPSSSAWAFEPGGLTDDSNPVPYYASNFTVTGSGETDITERILDWNITVNNNASPLYAFNGENFPVDIFLGLREVRGSFTYYATDGIFVEFLTHGATATITFGSTTLNLSHLAFGRSPVPSSGPNAVVTRNVEFIAVAKSASLPAIYKS